MKEKVFGIGLSKTGTSSLAEALNMLGIRSIHYPNDTKTYSELRSGNFRLSLFNQYDGIVDTPVVPYYAQFDQLFPGSKFILTVREKNSWLASVEQHWRAAATYDDQPVKKAFQEFIRTAVYGCIDFDKERFSYVYDLHHENVRKYFADRPDDLLVMNICNGEGWDVLSPFLNKPIPRTPFPHANEWMTKLIQASRTFSSTIPDESLSILIDDQLLGEEFTQGRRYVPFVEMNGVYVGPPADGKSGLHELKQTIAKYSPDHIVIAWPSFWWLEHYPEISNFLKEHCTIIAATDELRLYKIGQ